MDTLFTKLRERQIFKVATIYVVAAWTIIQIFDIAVQVFGLPETVLPLLFKVFVYGFPVSLIFAWLMNFTPDGLVRAGISDADAAADESRGGVNRKAFGGVVGSLLVVALITVGSQLFFGADQAAQTTTTNLPKTPDSSLHDGRESIAVLPFEVFSDDVEDEHFVDGMVEELLNLLAKVPELSVAARTSSFAYKGVKDKTITQIGQELGVDRILEGSLRKNDVENRIRITAQLIEVSTGAHLFSETFDREYRDIFQIQDEIANLVTEKMKHTLLPQSQPVNFVAGTHNVDAMVEFGKGQKELAHRTSTSLEKALTHFETAASMDDSYARAFNGIADANILLALYGSLDRERAFERADTAIKKALDLDPNSGAAYASKGLLHSERFEIEQAERAFQKAIELNSNYAMAYMWYGSLMRSQGNEERANGLFARAYELDPKSPVAAFNVAWGHYLRGDESAAMDWFSRIVANDPYYPGAYTLVGGIVRDSGRLDEALEMYERALQVDPQNKSAVMGLLVAAMDLGDKEEVEKWFGYIDANPGLLTENERIQLRGRYYISTNQEELAVAEFAKLRFSESERYLQLLIDGEIAYFTGDFETAIKSFEALLSSKFAQSINFVQVSEGQPALHLARAYQQTGAADKAKSLMDDIREYYQRRQQQNPALALNYYNLAMIYAMQGTPDEAINYLQAAIDTGWVQAWQADIEPVFDSLRTEPRYQQMMGGVSARLAYMRSRLNQPDEPSIASGLNF